jgi:linearmycin/streptolysin S transport system permease protein
MRASLVILGKDLRQRVRDRSALLVAIVVPLVLASIFGLIFHNAITGKVTFTFGVVDQDRGPVSRAFATEVLAPLQR